MCFPFGAVPPAIPESLRIAGGAAGEPLTLTSGDGTDFSAYLARAPEGTTGVVVLPDVRGLFRFYEQLAERFADAGHSALAFDYFGRTAGLGPRDESFEYMPHVRQTTPDTVALDVRAAVEWLREETGATTLVSVGFCFGGAQSFMQGARDHGLAGVVGFYGSLVREGQRWTLDRASEISVPVLGLFAGDDKSITADQVAEFESRLRVAHEIHTYEDAPHSFFDRRQEQYAEQSQDAWERILRFISQLQAEG
jgi:carboxymethylenebutenolidase